LAAPVEQRLGLRRLVPRARSSPISASICARLRAKVSPLTSSLDWMAGTGYASDLILRSPPSPAGRGRASRRMAKGDD
jgi:hypothetical protein